MDGDTLFNYHLPDISRFPQAEYVAEQLWKATGLSPADIDTATLYDAQSPSVFYQLEAFGFCGPGEARDYIADGHIELGGRCPVNTHGGLLGEAYIHGINSMVEGVRQIRGTAVNQVPGARHVLCSSGKTAVVFAAG
jgi:acetyl-CoA acetyltransferase